MEAAHEITSKPCLGYDKHFRDLNKYCFEMKINVLLLKFCYAVAAA